MNYQENKRKNIEDLHQNSKSKNTPSELVPKNLNNGLTDHYDQDEMGNSQYDKEEKHNSKPED